MEPPKSAQAEAETVETSPLKESAAVGLDKAATRDEKLYVSARIAPSTTLATEALELTSSPLQIST